MDPERYDDYEVATTPPSSQVTLPPITLPPVGMDLPAAAKYLQCLYHLPELAKEPLVMPDATHWEAAINEVIQAIIEYELNTTAALVGYFSGTEIGTIFTEFKRRDSLISQDQMRAQWNDLQAHRQRRQAKFSRSQIRANADDDAEAVARLIALRQASKGTQKP